MKRVARFAALFTATAALSAGCSTMMMQDINTPLEQCLISSVAPAGGAPVIVVPGFMTNDAYMGSLQGRLREKGWQVYGWGAGVNTGADAGKARLLQEQLDKVYRRHGQKVAVVGYSLGGVYARELARANPGKVSQVVTLGAPFGLRDDAGQSNARVQRIQNYYNAGGTTENPALAPPVPTVSVYSRNDGLVPWQASQSAGKGAQNIEVRQGHLTMPFNREVAAVVLNRMTPEAETSPATCRKGMGR